MQNMFFYFVFNVKSSLFFNKKSTDLFKKIKIEYFLWFNSKQFFEVLEKHVSNWNLIKNSWIKKIIIIHIYFNGIRWIIQSNHHRLDDFLRSNQHTWFLYSYSAYKFQNKQLVYEGPYYKYFFHPYMQATTMFFGEFIVLGGYFLLKKRNPEKYKMDML